MTFSLFLIIVITSTIVIIVTTSTIVIIVTTRTIIRVGRRRFKQLLWKFKTLRANCAHGHF